LQCWPSAIAAKRQVWKPALPLLGDLTGARAHFQRALRIFQESLDDDHPHTVLVRNNLNSL
jgi:hypothetical protein